MCEVYSPACYTELFQELGTQWCMITEGFHCQQMTSIEELELLLHHQFLGVFHQQLVNLKS